MHHEAALRTPNTILSILRVQAVNYSCFQSLSSVCLGLLMLSTYRYPPSAGVMSKCSSHYQCTIFFPLRNDSSSYCYHPYVLSIQSLPIR